MNSIDALYAGFVSALPESLRPVALDLPHLLQLSSAPRTTWGQALNHQVTLEAPGLVASAFPNVTPELVRSATFAHALAVIEAYGIGRIASRQVRPTPELTLLLSELRRARYSMLESVYPAAIPLARSADQQTGEAIKEENSLLRRLGAVSFEEYRRITLAKQAVGFTASLALARAAGASEMAVTQVERALAGAALALQFEDDAGDWEDDWRRGGGAWRWLLYSPSTPCALSR